MPDDLNVLMQVLELINTGKLKSPFNGKIVEMQKNKIDKSVIQHCQKIINR